jgi:hypothetical protein
MEAASNAARCVLSKTNYRALSQKTQIDTPPLHTNRQARVLAAIAVSLVLPGVRDIPEAKSRCCPGHRSPKQNAVVTNYRPDRARTHPSRITLVKVHPGHFRGGLAFASTSI